MAIVNKNDVNQIFAENAPPRDKPAEFQNYTAGWDTSRQNNGKPTIKQFNYLQQRTDQNILYIHQRGAMLPYDENIQYASGAVVIKDGAMQQWDGSKWNGFGVGRDSGLVTWSGRSQEQKNREVISSNDLNLDSTGKSDNSKKDGVNENNIDFTKGLYQFTIPPSKPIKSSFRNGVLLLDGVEHVLDNNPAVIAPRMQTEVDGYNVRYSNTRLGISAGSKVPDSSDSYANTFIGEFSGGRIETPITRVTAVGAHTVRDAIKAYSADAFGTNVLKWGQYYDRVLSMGANSCINLGATQERVKLVNGIYNGANTLAARFDARYPAWRDKYWLDDMPSPSICMTEADYTNKATHVVAVGRNALGFSITATNAVAVGYDAMTTAIDASSSVAVGDRAMQYTVDTTNTVGIGASVMANTAKANQTIAIGNVALSNYTISEQNVAVGYQSLRGGGSLAAGATATGNVVIGRIAAANAGAGIANCVAIGHGSLSGEGATGDGHVALGHRTLGSLSGSTSVGNTAVGKDAGRYIQSGKYNTAIGTDALSLMQDGSNPTNIENSTAIGWGAKVSASNQLQLGSSAVTTYAFGSVQDRSDNRDKADIENMPDLMSDFVLNLRAVQGVWDMRDDYILDLFPLPTSPEHPNYVDLPFEPTKGDSSVDFLTKVAQYNLKLHTANLANEKFKAEYDAEYSIYQKLLNDRNDRIKLWWSTPQKDGSKKRTRKHNWFIAQEVKALADSLGIDFAGLQDHKLIDGTDTYTIGYEEFIPPIVATIQKLNKRLDAIEERLENLEKK